MRPPTLIWAMGEERDRQRCDDEVVLGDMEMGSKKRKRVKSRQSEVYGECRPQSAVGITT